MAKSKVGSRRVAARVENSATVEKAINVRPPMVVGLMIIAVLAAGLAIYQWTELLAAQLGRDTLCSINETFNCVSVWESSFSKSIHRATRLPIAGWGLVWAIAAFGAAALTFYGAKKNKPLVKEVSAVRLFALVGLAVSVFLFAVTLSLGTYCVTCWATYALVISYALFAWKVTPGRADLFAGIGNASALTAVGYLLLLYPGTNTPVEIPKLTKLIEQPKNGQPREQKPTGDILSDFLIQLPAQVQQQVSESLHEYRQAKARPRGNFATRRLLGAASAPVQIIEWSDIRCSHCKTFSEALHTIDQSFPDDAFAVELRQFPLDAACNPAVDKEMIDPTHVRCAAALSLICLENTAGFREAQEKMFSQQHALSIDVIFAAATAGGGMTRAELEKCMVSPEAAQKLKEDIEFALGHGLHGTPLVVINGREASSFEPWVYALVLAAGDDRAPGWNVLPKATGQHAHQH